MTQTKETTPADHVKAMAQMVLNHAKQSGLVVTISTAPRSPLAMGNYDMVVAAPKALFNCEQVTALTEKKTASIIADRGYNITGFVLGNGKGQKCISDMSAVRWFDDGRDFFKMMHSTEKLKVVSGVVLREGSPTLLRDRDIKPTDKRLYSVETQ